MALDCLVRRNQVYDSTVGITKELDFYVIVVKTMVTMTVCLLNFYLAVTECDSPLENTVCDIASNRQIETREFKNMNANSIIDYTKRYDKSEVTLCCRKFDPDFAVNQDQYTVNPNDLPALVVHDSCLYIEDEEI